VLEIAPCHMTSKQPPRRRNKANSDAKTHWTMYR
jgi:hypothetical protein